MKLLLSPLKGGLIIGISVFLTLTLLSFKPSLQWGEVDILKLIHEHALKLGKQELAEAEINQKVADFMSRVQKISKKVSEQHKVILLVKGSTLSPLPDWTPKMAHLLDAEK